MTHYNNIDEMYSDIERHDEMLKRGRELYSELQQIKKQPNPLQSDEQEFIHNLKSKYDYDCLRLAMDKFDSQEPVPPPSPPTTSIDLSDLHTKIDDIQKTVSDDGLQKVTISEATETYYHWYIQDKQENKSKEVPPKTEDDKQRTLKTFALILGESRALKELTQDIVENEYVAKAKRIPQRLGNIYSHPPNRKNVEILSDHIDEILKIGITKDRISKSNDTLNREFITIKMFLLWAEERSYVAKGLGSFIPSMSANKGKKTANPSFTPEDLTLLFNSKHYVHGSFKKPSDYWMPLLGLFTGCRGNELAFLFKEDIRKHPDNGIQYIYIRINPEIAKRAKSRNSVRSIPIHPQLKKLGFLKYVASLKDGSRLFPELIEDKRNKGDFYKKWGNSFNRHEVEKKNGKPILNKSNGKVRMRRGYMTQCGVEKHVTIEDYEATKTFKSFRHMLVNFLDKNTNPRTKNFIIGHKQENQSVENYIHPDATDLREANKVLQKLKVPTVAWEMVKEREWR
jgi:integrase